MDLSTAIQITRLSCLSLILFQYHLKYMCMYASVIVIKLNAQTPGKLNIVSSNTLNLYVHLINLQLYKFISRCTFDRGTWVIVSQIRNNTKDFKSSNTPKICTFESIYSCINHQKYTFYCIISFHPLPSLPVFDFLL